MKVELSNRILRHIAKLNACGRHAWAAAWANEYLDENDPIRKALVGQLNNQEYSEPAMQQASSLLVGGAKYGDLPMLSRLALKASDREQGVAIEKQRYIPRRGLRSKRWCNGSQTLSRHSL